MGSAQAWDRLLIVTSKEYEQEAKALRRQASTVTRSVSVLLVENKGMHVGMFFDDNEEIFGPYTTIIAATEYSLVTTKRPSGPSAGTRSSCRCRFPPTTAAPCCAMIF